MPNASDRAPYVVFGYGSLIWKVRPPLLLVPPAPNHPRAQPPPHAIARSTYTFIPARSLDRR
jgi:hypothetical protein